MVKYKNEKQDFTYIYFLEEKKTHTLTYLGSINTTKNSDPTERKSSTFDA